jgi:serine/threonine protein kinase
VCDFGEALLLPVEGKAPPGGDESKEGSVEDKLVGLVGTRGYMAPEVRLVQISGPLMLL